MTTSSFRLLFPISASKDQDLLSSSPRMRYYINFACFRRQVCIFASFSANVRKLQNLQREKCLSLFLNAWSCLNTSTQSRGTSKFQQANILRIGRAIMNRARRERLRVHVDLIDFPHFSNFYFNFGTFLRITQKFEAYLNFWLKFQRIHVFVCVVHNGFPLSPIVFLILHILHAPKSIEKSLRVSQLVLYDTGICIQGVCKNQWSSSLVDK